MSDPIADQPHAPSDQIRADRACAGCGFNLYGQSVSREEHYGLAIARCPECGTVAALQQYPVMTHWVNRFRLIIGGIYIILLLGMFALSTFAISGFGIAAAEIASEPLADHLALQHTIWEQQVGSQPPGDAQVPAPINQPLPQYSRWNILTPKWIDEELDEAMQQFGGIYGNMNAEVYILLVPSAFVSLVFGIFWSVALLGSNRSRVLVVPAAIAIIAGVILVGANFDSGNYPSARALAENIYVMRLIPLLLVYEFIFMGIGVLIGRPIARFVVKLALPPRSRVPFGVLWSRDGLSMPSTNSARASRSAT